jgi:nicotinamide-nucleotide amidase
MLTPEITEAARRIGTLLRETGETVAVAEGSAGGLVSAALLSISGASAYYMGGTVIYTAAASRAWMAGEVDVPPGMRGATEAFAEYLAASVRHTLTGWTGDHGPVGQPGYR